MRSTISSCNAVPSRSTTNSSIQRERALAFTNGVSSWVEHRDLSNPDSHGPGRRHPCPAISPLPADRG
jgi:hypothetical protein